MHSPLPTRPARRAVARVLAVLALAGCALALGACGHRHRHVHSGFVLVDNRTDLTTNELLLSFHLAAFGEPFTGNLLAADLPAGAAVNLGSWQEDYYDAEGDLELGQLIEWFDLLVGNGQTTVFEAQ